MNVSEIAKRVKRQFGDEAGAQITDEDILRWVNDGQRDLAVSNDLLQTTATTRIKNGQDQYHLPPDILTLRSVRIQGRRLESLTADQAASWTPNVNQPKGMPTHFSQWALKIDLYPVPDFDDPNDLQIYYTRHPIPLQGMDETPELPVQYHNRLVDYCLAQAHELDDNMESYQLKMREFKEGAAMINGLDQVTTDVYSSVAVSSYDMDGGDWYYA